MADYAPEYSQANIQKLTDQYSQLLEPTMQRSRAALANLLGGRGSLYGTPGSNKLQLLEGQKLNQVGQYGQNLMTTGLGQTAQERLLAEQRAYEDPYKQAELLGTYKGQDTLQGRTTAGNIATQSLQNQWMPAQYTGYTPTGASTMQREQWDVEKPFTERLVKAQENAANIQMYKDQYAMLAPILNAIPGIGDYLKKILGA